MPVNLDISAISVEDIFRLLIRRRSWASYWRILGIELLDGIDMASNASRVRIGGKFRLLCFDEPLRLATAHHVSTLSSYY